MPRNKPRVEYVSITPDGFRYRGRVHANTANLLKWFKEHFRDPVSGSGMKAFFLYIDVEFIVLFCIFRNQTGFYI